jgi:hypothetical protein
MASRSASLLPLALLALAACPRDKKNGAEQVPVDSTSIAAADTTPADLSTLTSNIPAAAPDTFRRRPPAAVRRDNDATAAIPEAPEALMSAVQRELAFQRFCYQEFGQKADPELAGNVAMVVSVNDGGISGASVGNSRWTSNAGQAVNRCLSQRAPQAWKLAPGAVRPGRYVVQLSFRGT